MMPYMKQSEVCSKFHFLKNLKHRIYNRSFHLAVLHVTRFHITQFHPLYRDYIPDHVPGNAGR